MRSLSAINSATKYPSILTYHAMGQKGRLTDELTATFDNHELLYGTEKIDGTNGRIVQLPGRDWYIGSREELLTARGDRVHNPTLGIVDALKEIAQRLPDLEPSALKARVWFFEVFGGKITGASKEYTSTGKVDVRLFDVALVPLHVLSWEPEKIASWRDAGGQDWECTTGLEEFAEQADVKVVPPVWTGIGASLPKSVDQVYGMLCQAFSEDSESGKPESYVPLDKGAGQKPEGLVVRTDDRSKIVKIRFEDYVRTLKARA